MGSRHQIALTQFSILASLDNITEFSILALLGNNNIETRLLEKFLQTKTHRDQGQKLPSWGVFGKRCSEKMQQVYRRTLMPKSDFHKVAMQKQNQILQGNFTEITIQHRCSSVNLLHIFRKLFPKNSSGGLHLQ